MTQGNEIIIHPGPQKVWDLDAPMDRKVAFSVIEKVAFGLTLRDIEKLEDMPPYTLFLKWLMINPGIARAYTVAREISGYSFEDEILHLARELVKAPGSAANIKATEVLINQLKWAAGKRNPNVFSEKAEVNITVPIQINTSLDMGPVQGGGTREFPNIYEMKAETIQEVEVSVDRETGEASYTSPPAEGTPGGRPSRVLNSVRAEARELKKREREEKKARWKAGRSEFMKALNAKKRAEREAREAQERGETPDGDDSTQD